MANRFQRFFESIAYAGLRPSGAPQKESQGWRWLGPLREPLERFLSGGRQMDPLYLSNRTWSQKLKLALVIAAPCVLLLGALAFIFGYRLAPKTAPPHQQTSAEIVARLLPDLEKTVQIPEYKDAEILEIRVDRSGAPKVTGRLHNRTSHELSVEFTVDFTDESGSRVGAEVERVEKAPPGSTVPFTFPIRDSRSAFPLVRDVHTVK
jgi:hypothetical protein